MIFLLAVFGISFLYGQEEFDQTIALQNAQGLAGMLRNSAQASLQKGQDPSNPPLTIIQHGSTPIIKEESKEPLAALSPNNEKRIPAAIPKAEPDNASAENNKGNAENDNNIVLTLPSIKDLDEATIDFYFENADLQNVADYIAELLHISFITDDAVKPMMQGGRGVIGNKISFRSQRPMTKRQAFELFNTFLDLAGLALVATPNSGVYRIMVTTAANRAPLPALIDVDPDFIPSDDLKIRYVRFLKNAQLPEIQPIVQALMSSSASLTFFSPLKAFIITDKAYNIKALINIIDELDTASMPETLAVIKLKRANAEDVKKLFDELMRPDESRGLVARVFGKKSADVSLLPEGTRFIAEPRSNSLVIIGNKDTIAKIEKFIADKIDMEINLPESPFYIYELQHNDAASMADILNKVTQFGIGTPVGAGGSVREGQKFFKRITFTPEIRGNRLIIRADYEDYLKAREIIEKLDVMQPQVAFELLVVNVDLDSEKALGFQMRNKNDTTVGKGVDFQNSGLPLTTTTFAPIQVDPVNGSLMANLISLAAGNGVGSSLISFGIGANIWMMFKALEAITNVSVISNPFLTVANKFKATTSLGETRRVVVGTITGFGTTETENDNETAALEVEIEPQINAEGIITMNLSIKIDNFVEPTNFTSATKTTRHLRTTAIAANKEVLALGGLIRDFDTETAFKLPILGDIPLIGNLFRNKSTIKRRQSLLIFISPEIVQPRLSGGSNIYTQKKADYARAKINLMEYPTEKRDPVQRWFFKGDQPPTQELDDFMNRRAQAIAEEINISSYYSNYTTPVEPRTPPVSANFQQVNIPGPLEQQVNATANNNNNATVIAPITIPEPPASAPTSTSVATPSKKKYRNKYRKRSLSSYLNNGPESGV